MDLHIKKIEVLYFLQFTILSQLKADI